MNREQKYEQQMNNCNEVVVYANTQIKASSSWIKDELKNLNKVKSLIGSNPIHSANDFLLLA